jgi:hypothetical protein
VQNTDQRPLEKEADVNQEPLPMLAAYRDNSLSAEAAEEIVRLVEDSSTPVHAGEDLPLADKAALLRKALATQKVG